MKSPNCELCDKTENIIHLYIDCKRNKKTWKYFQKYYQTLTQKQNTPLQHILTISSLSLPPKTKKLTLALITTILTHIWKTRNKLQFDDAIIPATNVIMNIKNELKNIILTHYKHHTINNTLHEFQSNFCINNALCKLTPKIVSLCYSKETTKQAEKCFTYLSKQNFPASTLCLKHPLSHKRKNLTKLFNSNFILS